MSDSNTTNSSDVEEMTPFCVQDEVTMRRNENCLRRMGLTYPLDDSVSSSSQDRSTNLTVIEETLSNARPQEPMMRLNYSYFLEVAF